MPSARIQKLPAGIGRCLLIMCAAAALSSGCSDDAGAPLDANEHYGPVERAEILEPIGFTDQNYDFSGEMQIADLLDEFDPEEVVWYGLSPQDPYAMGDERVLDVDCDPNIEQFENRVDKIDALPAYIEGIVTLHPRLFQKVSVCGQDERYYGVYYLQDESGGIMVLRDSRLAAFTYGNRVRMRVRGVMQQFGTQAVMTYDNSEIYKPETRYDIYYEEADEPLGPDDVGKVRRVRGTVISEPTNDNFNELILRNDDDTHDFAVALDREFGMRGVELELGQRVQITGPVAESYGAFTVLVASLGQIEWLDES
jgi:hypothetical protein